MTYYTKQEANNTITHYFVDDEGCLFLRHGMSSYNVLADNVPWEQSLANVNVILAQAKLVSI